MRSLILLALLASPAVADDAADVRAVLLKQEKDWNRGDLAGFMTTYDRSDDTTFYSGGTVTKGWQTVFDRYKARYQADGKEMGKLTFSDLVVTPLGTDTALARGRWKVVMSKDSADGLFTLVLKKTAGGWKITHDHTSASDKK